VKLPVASHGGFYKDFAKYWSRQLSNVTGDCFVEDKIFMVTVPFILTVEV
jgi:hypothetical protein